MLKPLARASNMTDAFACNGCLQMKKALGLAL